MPTTPVAKPARAEDARQRRPARLDDQRSVAGQDAGARLAPRIFAGEHRVAGRRAGGGRRMCVGETDAFARQPIDVRRLDARGAVGGDIAVAEIVGVDQDDVRPGLGCRQPAAVSVASAAAARTLAVIVDSTPDAGRGRSSCRIGAAVRVSHACRTRDGGSSPRWCSAPRRSARSTPPSRRRVAPRSPSARPPRRRCRRRPASGPTSCGSRTRT